MGHNVQSQAGDSLADVYDVKGGQAPVERLLTSDVPVVHEMGATIQSERFSSTIRKLTTGPIAQNTNFDIEITDLPSGVSRILGVTVLANVTARADFVAVFARDPTADREVPIFVWDTTTDLFKDIRIRNEGAAANILVLAPQEAHPAALSMITGPDQPQRVSSVSMRGRTTGFGAGTVEHTLLLHIAFAAIGGISSRGLPVPSW